MGNNEYQSQKVFLFKELTHKIIGAAFEVYRNLGFGFIPEVYEEALIKELEINGIFAKKNSAIKINYKGDIIEGILPSILVDDKVIVELQTAEKDVFFNEHNIINKLKATGIKVGLIINFGRVNCKPKRYVA